MTSPSLYQKSLVGYLYFVQGIFLVIPSTIILTYQKIPSYDILAMFSFAILPFSFKFIAAPVIEKYTFNSYGRRKTWVVISLIIASLLTFCTTFFTQEEPSMQLKLAMCLTAVVFMVALEDISTDALAVKQLHSSELASFMQCVWQPIGGVVGSLFFLELVGGSLYKKLGFDHPFMTINEYLSMLAVLILVSVMIIHFTYHEKGTALPIIVNEQQKEDAQQSLWGVIKNYRFFINPRYRQCRQCLLFLLHHHGITYFSSSFSVQMIKSNIISKDVLTSLSNFLIIPVYFLTTLLRNRWSNVNKVHERTQIIISLRLVLMVLVFFSGVETPVVVYIALSVLSLLNNVQFFLSSLISNNFSDFRYAGMYVTMMASFTNFGNNSTIQLEVIAKFGYSNSVIFGFLFTVAVVLLYKKIGNWVNQGEELNENVPQPAKSKSN